MSREVRRVPLDFDWPLSKVWDGFLMPQDLQADECADCEGSGYSPTGALLYNRWYGNAYFIPSMTGSVRFNPDNEAIQHLAKRNVEQFLLGVTLRTQIEIEAQRLCDLFNSRWCHHLDSDDVAALLGGSGLWDFTHTWSREIGWVKKDPEYIPTAVEVNQWSIEGLGHDSVAAFTCVKARCERAGEPWMCATCKGQGTVEAYPGQRAQAEAWECTDPPEGEGWQLWETTSEGSPVTPVFPELRQLCDYAAIHCTTFAGHKATAEQWYGMLSGDGFVSTEIAPGIIAI